MNMSPIITKALMDSRQRDLLAQARQARQARLAREAGRVNRAAGEALPAARHPARRRWRRLWLAGLFWAH
jgi:hypothetical protein